MAWNRKRFIGLGTTVGILLSSTILSAEPVLDCSLPDAAVSWNQIVTDSLSDPTLRVARIPSGACVFKTRPLFINNGLNWIGAGIGNTVLIRDYAPSYTTEPFFQFGGGSPSSRGGGIRRAGILANGFQGGRAILATGVDATNRAGYMKFSELYITAANGGNWFRNIDVDGGNILTSGTQGLRNISIIDSYLFCASDANIYGRNVVHFEVRGGASVVGTGTCTGVGKIRITGEDHEFGKSTDFVISTKVYGDVVLERCHIGFISGNITQNLVINSTCSGNGTSVAQINGTVDNRPTPRWKVF